MSKLRPLGAAVVVVVALVVAATGAATAAAEPVYLFAEEEVPVALTGTQHSENDVFTVNAGTVTCANATYTGELSEQEAEAVDIAPSYSGCTAFGFATATFDMNGCVYRLANVTIEGEGQPKGKIDIVCPGSEKMKVTVSLSGTVKCTIHIPAQQELGSVVYTNAQGSATQITAAIEIKGELAYTQTAGTGLGACSSGSAENGSYAGAALVGGKGAEEEAVDVALLAANPTFVVNPAPVTFKAQAQWEKITIENKSKTEEPKLDFMIVTPIVKGSVSHGYKGSCEDKTLKKEGVLGANCPEEVICIFQGKVSYLNIGSSASYAFYKTELKAC